MENYNKHYISIDDRFLIVDGFSTAFRDPVETDICINDQGTYQFRLFADGPQNPSLVDNDGIPLYAYINEKIVERTDEEIEHDRKNLPPKDPTLASRVQELEAQNEMLMQCLLEMSELVYA